MTDVHRPHLSHRRRLQSVVSALVVGCLVVAILVLEGHHSKSTTAPPPVATTPPPPVTSLTTPGFAFGFYSAGLRLVDCYGSCRSGTKDYALQQADRQRMAQLQAMHVTFVTNNESIVRYYRHNPAAVLRYLDELHAHHIRVSYSIASGAGMWFSHGQFNPRQAETVFARTDKNNDGVSDLDGRLDVVYQGHEVLEWATHAQRVQIYRIAKHWFPHTPIAFYYAGIYRPVDPAWAKLPHNGGPGGDWRDYAYGPGETDIALVNVRRTASPSTLDNVDENPGRFNATDFAAAARLTVSVVKAQTPKTPVFISTNIAGDPAMNANPASMWSAADLRAWYDALAATPGVDGVQLRSFGRFTYDLGNARFAAQQATWRQLGALAAQIKPGGRAP